MFSNFSIKKLPIIGNIFRYLKNSIDPNSTDVKRIYPTISSSTPAAKRPISFIVVRYSDAYLHNFAKSECINSHMNELIEVDNTYNIYFDNLSSAIAHGVKKTKYDLIVVIHENVLLPARWQSQFEKSLDELEKKDSNWGILGSIGWNSHGARIGHSSDTQSYINTLKDSAVPYEEVGKLDEQVLVFHKGRLPIFDPSFPSIDSLGNDLIEQMKERRLKCYILDAPIIHKYADNRGNLMLSDKQIEKIPLYAIRSYSAAKACSDDYINHKYQRENIASEEFVDYSTLDQEKINQLDQPIILLSRGGSGSRILSRMAQDSGVFIGDNLNTSGDSVDLVIPIYKILIEKYRCHAIWQRTHTLSSLRSVAASAIQNVPSNQLWGFKLPESVLIIPELESIFPKARYVYFQRDPLSICLRRTHLTARLDNYIGQITLPLAYDHANIDRRRILVDHPAQHMAYTTIHQVGMINAHINSLPDNRKLTVRFEDTIENPGREVSRLAAWLKSTASGESTKEFIDLKRASNPTADYSPELEAMVSSVLEDLRKESGYL